MRTLLVISLLLLSVSKPAYSQSKRALKIAKSIKKTDLYDRLSVLTSDSLEGRATGEPGLQKAANFIASEFERYGLQPIVQSKDGVPSYFQPFTLSKLHWGETYLKAVGKTLVNYEDMLYLSNKFTAEVTADVVFAGELSEGSLQVDTELLAGKVVAIKIGESREWAFLQSKFLHSGIKGLLLFGGDTDEHYNSLVSRYKIPNNSPFLSIDEPDDFSGFSDPNYSPDGYSIRVFLMKPSTALTIFGKPLNELVKDAASGLIPQAPISFKTSEGIDRFNSQNVLGFLEGTDKKDEVLVITAHYDHLGEKNGKIYHGADDDGSGTSAVLEIAEAFATAKRKGWGPRRSILFMTVAAEEIGLLGSDYYTRSPVIPLSQTVANLNIDMIGRVDNAHQNNENYIYLIGSDKLSQELHLLSEAVNTSYTQLALDYTYNDENDPNRFYYRSDHYNFAKNNIPIIFYFNGVHADYHQPTDTIEKIAFDKMTKIVRLVFFTGWEIANREDRIRLDTPPQ